MSESVGSAALSCPQAASNRVFQANLLFLISLVLILTLGAGAQLRWGWPGLISTELICILAPAWLFARATDAPNKALRLEWAGATPCLLGLLCGVGTLPLAGAAGTLGSKILGYEFSWPDQFWPVGLGSTIAFVVGSAVIAPFCEEMLFRGYILSAYEEAGWRSRITIVAVAGLFTAWHVSPARASGVAVFAMLFTYLACKTGSVWPAMAAHVGGNGAIALLALVRGRLAAEDPSALRLLLAAVPGALVTLWCLTHISHRTHLRPAPVNAGKIAGWWPLWIAGLVIAVIATADIAAHMRQHARQAPAAGGRPSKGIGAARGPVKRIGVSPRQLTKRGRLPDAVALQ